MKKYLALFLLTTGMLGCEQSKSPTPTKDDLMKQVERCEHPEELRRASDAIEDAENDWVEHLANSIAPEQEAALLERDNIMQHIKRTDPVGYGLWETFQYPPDLYDKDSRLYIEGHFGSFQPLREFNKKYYGPDSLMYKLDARGQYVKDSLRDVAEERYAEHRAKLKQKAVEIFKTQKSIRRLE